MCFFFRIAIIIILAVIPLLGNAQVFSSSNFRVIDPVIDFGGDRSTSASFVLLQVFGQLSLGTSTSASFQVNPGFLPFPVVTLPTLSATARDAEVDLSWDPSVGFLGWTVSDYNVGQATVSGGPYTYTDVGSTTATTITGLTNDTEYFFVLRPEDTFGNTIGTTTEVSATPTAGAPAPPPSGGGRVSPGPRGDAVFRGHVYPNAHVSLLRDSSPFVRTRADEAGAFELVAPRVTEGTHTFGIFAEDTDGRASRLVTFTVLVAGGETTAVQGIFIPPTIEIDKSTVAKEDTLFITGQSRPGAEIQTSIFSEKTPEDVALGEANAGPDGRWAFALPAESFPAGTYGIFARAFLGELRSLVSQTLTFTVGEETIVIPPEQCPLKGDLNGDCRVELVDFSIAAFYYKEALPPEFKEKERLLLNGDDVVDFKDFSLMAFWWTG